MIVHAPSYSFALGAIALSGVTAISYTVTIDSLLQRGVADQYRGRILGAYGMVQSTVMLLGMGLGSVLGTWLGMVRSWDIVVGLTALGGVCALVLLRGSGAAGAMMSEAV